MKIARPYHTLIQQRPPGIAPQKSYYRQLELRDRILKLPLMIAAVLTLLWRELAGVTELTRLLNREGFLWVSPKKSSNRHYLKYF